MTSQQFIKKVFKETCRNLGWTITKPTTPPEQYKTCKKIKYYKVALDEIRITYLTYEEKKYTDWAILEIELRGRTILKMSARGYDPMDVYFNDSYLYVGLASKFAGFAYQMIQYSR